MSARLLINSLRCAGRHGVYEGEQDAERPFLVDLAVRADVWQAATRDDLSASVDFAALAATVREVVGGPPRAILETVTLEVAQTILQRFERVQEISVTLRKQEPAGLEADEEAVEVTLTRQ